MAETSVQLRDACAPDVAVLTSLIDAAYKPYRQRGIALPDVSGGIASDIEERIVRVATRDETILGVAVASIDGTQAHLMNIAVSPDAAGQGIGKLLMTEVTRLAREAGIPTLRLATHQDIPENVSLYEHLGFSVTGPEAMRVLMEKPI